jgi:hypothetical protein
MLTYKLDLDFERYFVDNVKNALITVGLSNFEDTYACTASLGDLCIYLSLTILSLLYHLSTSTSI